MGSRAVRARFEPVRSLAAASITSSYVPVGTVLANPARLLFIQNLTDASVMFSTNGIDDHFPLLSSAFFVDDVCTNKTHDDGLFLPKGDGLWVKRIGTPTTGSVYFTVMYGAEA